MVGRGFDYENRQVTWVGTILSDIPNEASGIETGREIVIMLRDRSRSMHGALSKVVMLS